MITTLTAVLFFELKIKAAITLVSVIRNHAHIRSFVMPVDTTKSRRIPRKIDEEELKEIELKRLRGEISCAECRRLKLKCDKKVPCGSCVRRGCDTICPCGILHAGQGTRFILADTEQLHRKIAEMSLRIRQLEDALAILQATVSSERHPLLHDDLIKIKFGSEVLNPPNQVTNQESSSLGKAAQESIEALGTLTLGDEGESYFGSSAGTLTLLLTASEEWDAQTIEDEGPGSLFPLELGNMANLFPFTMRRKLDGAFEALEAFLPSRDRALALCESYIDHVAVFFRPIKKDELFESLVPSIYSIATMRPLDGSEDCNLGEQYTPHSLASLFFVFGLGALFDLELPPYNSEAEQYYNLGRAALSLREVFHCPTMETVRAVGLMALHHYSAGIKYSIDSCWALMSLASKLAQSVGLHRDSARWNMDPPTVEKRRSLFWEVFTADVNLSLALGRPPSIHISYVDCEFPLDEEAVPDQDGKIQYGFWRMKYAFAKDIFIAVAQTTLAAKPPTYAAILDLDRRVRQFSFPENLKPYSSPSDPDYYSAAASIKSIVGSHHRTVMMLYLHRSFFAQALLDFPTNPLKSPFAPSFLIAYRCASIIIKATVHQFERCPEMSVRIWRILFHAFTAAMVVGSVVTRSPKSNLAPTALVELGVALDIFERSAKYSKRARIASTILRRMRDKAINARTEAGDGTFSNTPPFPPLTSSPSPFGPKPLAADVRPSSTVVVLADELAIFSGQVKVLQRKQRYRDSSSIYSMSTPSSTTPNTPSPSRADSEGVMSSEQQRTITPNPPPDIHPSLVDYISSTSDLFLQSHQPEPLTAQANARWPNLPLNPFDDKGTTLTEMYSLFMSSTPTERVASSSWDLSQYGMRDSPSTFGWPQGSPLAGENASVALAIHQLSSIPPQEQQQVFSSACYDNDPMAMSAMVTDPVDFPMFDGFGIGNGASTGGGVVDLGLSSESGMDEGWFSFMKECGILEGRTGVAGSMY